MEQGDSGTADNKGPAVRKNIWTRKRLAVVFGVLIGLSLLTGSLIWWNHTYVNTGNAKQVAKYQQDYQDMKYDQKPLSDQPSAKAKYYQELAEKAVKAGDYKGAIQAFDSHKAALGKDFSALQYLNLVTYHCRLNDKDSALDALKEATNLRQASADDKAQLNAAKEMLNNGGCQAWLQPLDLQ